MMRWIKNGILLLLTAALLSMAAGCASIDVRGDAIRAFNDTLKAVTGWSLTREDYLQGTRTFGEDCYVGEYSAEYNHFYGKETLFGGTALEREEGTTLTVNYALRIDSGKAKLYWMDRGKERLLCSATAEKSVELTLQTGSNYIIVEGDDWKGGLELTIE